MKQKEWIERIAAGLREMTQKPDFLLLSGNLYTFESICNIKTITTSLGVTSGYDGDSFNVFPCWINDGDYEMDIYYFQKGYTNYKETYGGGEQ
jgi:hypothetical protein